MRQSDNDLPKKISIFSKEFDIVYCDKVEDVDADHKEMLRGQIDFDDNEIRIFRGKKTGPTEILHVILHEILHVVKANTSLKFSDETEEEEDTVIDCLSMGIAHFLVENKFVTQKWLKKKKQV